jgi:hypothetical protein
MLKRRKRAKKKKDRKKERGYEIDISCGTH